MADKNSQTNPQVVTPQNAAEAQAAEAAKKRADAETAAPAKAQAVATRGEPVVAINLITQTGDDGKPEDILPGTVFKPATADVAFLTAHEAIRKPTDAEMALHEQVEKMKRDAAIATGTSADDTLG